jgi:uncharacterized protein (DUF433 family)
MNADPKQELESLRERVRVLEDVLAAAAPVMRWWGLMLPGAHPAFVKEVLYRLGHEAGRWHRDDGPEEVGVSHYHHLVHRRHPWRTQLSIRGVRMTARQLVGGMKANGWTPEQAAEQYRVPVEAVRESMQYVEDNAELLRFEAAYERLLGSRPAKEVQGGPRPASR